MLWLTDIRKVALLACVTSVASLITPGWNATRSMITTLAPLPWLLLPVLLALWAITALPPSLLLRVISDPGTIHVSTRLRLLARTAAFLSGIFLACQLAVWIKAPSIPISTLLGALATVANSLPLAAFARDPGDESSKEPLDETPTVSTLLYVVTKVTVIVWGVVMAVAFLGLILAPLIHAQIQHTAFAAGMEAPPLAALVNDAAQAFLSQACLWVPPFIVYRSRVRAITTALTLPTS